MSSKLITAIPIIIASLGILGYLEYLNFKNNLAYDFSMLRAKIDINQPDQIILTAKLNIYNASHIPIMFPVSNSYVTVNGDTVALITNEPTTLQPGTYTSVPFMATVSDINGYNALISEFKQKQANINIIGNVPLFYGLYNLDLSQQLQIVL
jgi:hypothetical protein